jgi:hypothetical protein
MASHFLTTASKLLCPHGGTITASTSNLRVMADGSPIIRAFDMFTIAGCPEMRGTVPYPCVRVEWDTHAQRHTSQSDPSLTLESCGYCLAADGGMQGVVEVSSTQSRGAGT